MIDITNPEVVEVLIRNDGKVIWVNINGVCQLRCYRIQCLVIDDKRKEIPDWPDMQELGNILDEFNHDLKH